MSGKTPTVFPVTARTDGLVCGCTKYSELELHNVPNQPSQLGRGGRPSRVRWLCAKAVTPMSLLQFSSHFAVQMPYIDTLLAIPQLSAAFCMI